MSASEYNSRQFYCILKCISNYRVLILSFTNQILFFSRWVSGAGNIMVRYEVKGFLGWWGKGLVNGLRVMKKKKSFEEVRIFFKGKYFEEYREEENLWKWNSLGRSIFQRKKRLKKRKNYHESFIDGFS